MQEVSALQIATYLSWFFLGAFVMRSAGCIVNDLWDRELDAKVERTRHRPLACGALSVRQALAFLLALLFAALGIVLQLPHAVFWLALAALPFVALYPLMKRLTWWPQAFLGLTFNFGALMGWTALTGFPQLPAWLLYFGGMFWTLAYDTIYAFQDIADDEKAGVKSTARLLKPHAHGWILGFYCALFACHLAAFWLIGATLGSFILYIPALTYFIFEVKNFDPTSPQRCGNIFKNAHWLGFWLAFPAIILNLP